MPSLSRCWPLLKPVKFFSTMKAVMPFAPASLFVLA